MALFKFLRRGKKQILEDLDMPPAPPLEDFDKWIEPPKFPSFDEERIFTQKDELPEFEFPEEKFDADELPELPSMPEMEEGPATNAPSNPMPDFSVAQERESVVQEEPFRPKLMDIPPKAGGPKLFSKGETVLRDRQTGRTIYVRVDRFKATISGINIIRNDLKKSQEALAKLENIKHEKEKSFDKIKSSLDDMQKKLIFIDKTLFKGD